MLLKKKKSKMLLKKNKTMKIKITTVKMTKTNLERSIEAVEMMTNMKMITNQGTREEEETTMTTKIMMMLIDTTTEVIEVTNQGEEMTMMTIEVTEAEEETDVEVTEEEDVEEDVEEVVEEAVEEVVEEEVEAEEETEVVTTKAETMTIKVTAIKEVTIKPKEVEDNKNLDKAFQSTNSISQLLDE